LEISARSKKGLAGIDEFLKKRQGDGLLRKLLPARFRQQGRIYFGKKEYIDFSSNDYLGLSHHPKLLEASKIALEKFGASASASRLLSGNLEIYHQLEEKIAQFKNKEAALVFNCGYQANLGIVSALYKRGDCIFSDHLNHASIVDAIALSGADFFRFQHNDINHLRLLLKKQRKKFKNGLIITETIFSMDGDRPPLKELVALKEKYNCQLLVDEAHSTGIFGKTGSGIAEEEGLSGQIELVMGTFSKALGSFGAYLATSKKIVDYLVNSCRSFIYSTALPPQVIAANLASIDLIKTEPFRRKKLLESAEFLRQALKTKGFRVKGTSQIVPLIIGETLNTIKFASHLQEKGFWVVAIRPPTVAKNQARLRFSLTFEHEQKTLEELINAARDFRI
jgi:8-amino-7-oxononanoate synthase